MTTPTTHHVAASLTQEALARVFDPAAVALLREDSPLSALSITDADMVCVADALADAASTRGLTCVLDDQDLAEVVTVADLVGATMVKLDAPEGTS